MLDACAVVVHEGRFPWLRGRGATFPAIALPAIALLVIALLTCVVGGGAEPPRGAVGGAPVTELERIERAYLEVAAGARPSVVSVAAWYADDLVGAQEGGTEPPDADAVEEGPVPVLQSGIILDADGLILTLGRGLDEAERLEVALADGRRFPARHLAVDPESRITILRMTEIPEGLAPIRPGDMTRIRPGSLVVAVGNPCGFAHSVAYGTVSGVDRHVPTYPLTSLLQITAPVNPGDQGGLVADSRGEAIGLIASTYRRSLASHAVVADLNRIGRDVFERFYLPVMRAMGEDGGTAGERRVVLEEALRALGPGMRAVGVRSLRRGALGTEGIHFAIPMDYALGIARRLAAGERVVRGWMGIRTGADLLFGWDGVRVDEVNVTGPAYGAGIAPGDVIVGFAGRPVLDLVSLRVAIDRSPVGESLPVEVVRGAERLRLTVVLVPRPEGAGGSEDAPDGR